MPSSENDNVADDEFEMDDLDDAEDFEDVDEGDTPNQTQPNNASNQAAVERLAEFVEYMVSSLVDDPETIQVIPEQFGTNVHIKVLVPEEDMGRVIGRQGRIARSMRTLLTISASRKGLRASLDIDS